MARVRLKDLGEEIGLELRIIGSKGAIGRKLGCMRKTYYRAEA